MIWNLPLPPTKPRDRRGAADNIAGREREPWTDRERCHVLTWREIRQAMVGRGVVVSPSAVERICRRAERKIAAELAAQGIDGRELIGGGA